LMSYEEAIGDWADHDRAFVAVQTTPRLGPGALIARVEAQRPGMKVNTVTLSSDPARSARIRFAVADKNGARPPSSYLDPYDGRYLGAPRLEAAFATIRDLHRWLLLPGEGKGWGRTITGASAMALLVFLGTGLYLRWPKIHSWRIWLKPNLGRPGRPRWWSLHNIAGTWLLPVYAVIALSGLWWSYDWYRDAATWVLTGEGPRAKPARTAVRGKEPPALDRAWATFQAGEGRDATLAILTVPNPDAATIRIRYQLGASRLRNEVAFDSATGARVSAARDADKALGRRMADNMLEVHRGRFFGDAIAFVFFAASLLMPLLAASGLVLYVLRRRAARRRARVTSAGIGPAQGLEA